MALMAKKHKPFKIPPLFKRDRDILSIANDQKKFAALKEVIDSATKVSEKLETCKTLEEWFAIVETKLPDFANKTEFTKKLEKLVYEYSNESEGSDPA